VGLASGRGFVGFLWGSRKVLTVPIDGSETAEGQPEPPHRNRGASRRGPWLEGYLPCGRWA